MKKYENYVSNLKVLSTAYGQNLENDFVIGGIIDKYYIQFELGWKVMKELLKYEGVSAAQIGSPREIIKESYKVYDFLQESVWLEMLRDRNDMTHIYNGEAARKLVGKILQSYIPEFEKLQENIAQRYGEVLENL